MQGLGLFFFFCSHTIAKYLRNGRNYQEIKSFLSSLSVTKIMRKSSKGNSSCVFYSSHKIHFIVSTEMQQDTFVLCSHGFLPPGQGTLVRQSSTHPVVHTLLLLPTQSCFHHFEREQNSLQENPNLDKIRAKMQKNRNANLPQWKNI